ncbi:dienelactone hydrolase [Roseimicrobium gellanilyticum]|uniref:Dienelactone hydrolase n=1 Tax=Roseimicrobium gellanilyticum TaxID=748857 RepID=A0A366H7P1_9BACT|nr:dienelactone hydrolase family protein [Roseimicrobium gellanilyticum]RBP38170.1 dienelactone hydrolase [Roseimicrobium gellanilyticum]
MKQLSPVLNHQHVPVEGMRVHIPVSGAVLEGMLDIPERAPGIVLFVHGSGSSHHSPRNQFVAEEIRKKGLGALLFDLLTQQEELADEETLELRFEIGFLAKRLIEVTNWLLDQPESAGKQIGFFGSSTGAAAALVAAAHFGTRVGAVVSRGGRPDLADNALREVNAPTLLIVGGSDYEVLQLNEAALRELRCEKAMKVIPGATHLFEEYGALPQVAHHAAVWLRHHLKN